MTLSVFTGRFIPTSVGNSEPGYFGSHLIAVHPHERGEQFLITERQRSIFGSSPRAWGTGYAVTLWLVFRRFIPTSVGNSINSTLLKNAYPVHPHERGEQPRARYEKNAEFGSSPRAWGTGRNKRSINSEYRFIPTSVGNRRRPSAHWLWIAVHPHERGEQNWQTKPFQTKHGSSPRAWGTGYRVP